MRRRLLWLSAILAVASNGSAYGQPTELPTDLPRHALVFASHSDAARKDYDVWRVCPDGTQLASLVTLPGAQTTPAVSPDGTEIVWVGREGSNTDIWRRDFNRGEPVRLTTHDGRDQSPAWSPDGRSLLYFSDLGSEKQELYLLDLETRQTERLTENELYDSGGEWSPDGTRIAFTRFFPAENEGERGRGEIVMIDLTTREERQLTELGGFNGGLDYSPDGRWIAFHRTSEEGSDLWLMNADGTDPRQITSTYVDEYSPTWSPDGSWIAFTAGTEYDGMGTFDLWLMRTDGSGRRLIVGAANTQMEPDWRAGEQLCR